MSKQLSNPGLQDHRGQGKNVCLYSLGLWPHNPSDLTSYRDSKTWEELKSLKRFQNSTHLFKNALWNPI